MRRYAMRIGSPIAVAAAVALTSGCSSLREAPQADVTPQPQAAVMPTGHPADAVSFGGHWYKVFEGDGSWQEKKVNCEAMGGYLACIETAEEQEFISGLAAGRYLSLGATDEAHEDTWVWVNGAPFDYTCWMSGQPNNWGDSEHYLATYDDGEWVDVAATGDDFWMPTGFICEWND